MKCTKLRNARAVRTELIAFVVKYADLWCFRSRRRYRRRCVYYMLQVGRGEGVTRTRHDPSKPFLSLKN